MNVTKQLYQWDTGQKLTECTGIYVDYLISDEVYRVEIIDGTCIIPDELLQTSGRYKVWECMADNTLREFAFKVLPRPIPPNYVFTPTEQLTFEGLVQKETNKFNTNAIEKLNAYNANADNRVAEFNAQTGQIQADVSELKSDLINEVSERNNAISNAVNNEKQRAISEEQRIESLFTLPTQDAVNNWLNEHPEATTTVQDGSIDEQKFVSTLKDKLKSIDEEVYYFGPDGTISELVNIITNGDYRKIILDRAVDLTISSQIIIAEHTTIIGNGATFRRSNGYDGIMFNVSSHSILHDFIIDGGSVTNGTWNNTIDVKITNDCIVSEVTINNGNECIIVYGSGNVVENCRINTAQGNGIHLSGCSKSVIRENIIKDTNLSESYTNGRCNIYVCDENYDCVIENNYCENGYKGIGDLNTTANQGIKISNNTVVNSRYAGVCAHFNNNEADFSPKNITIDHNTIKDSANVLFWNADTNHPTSDWRLVFDGNILINTLLQMRGCKDVIISNNILKGKGISFNYCEKCTINSNRIYHVSGVGIYGSAVSGSTISNNYVVAKNNGITLQDGSSKSIIVNNIINDSDETTSFMGITAVSGGIVNGNRVCLRAGTGIFAGSNQIAKDNIIVASQSDVIAIRVYGGVKNAIVSNNLCNSNASFGIVSITNGVVENNIVCDTLE